MKKIILILTVFLTLSLLLVACGSKEKESAEQTTVSEPVTSETQEEPTEDSEAPSEDIEIVLDEVEIVSDDDDDSSDESRTTPETKSGGISAPSVRAFDAMQDLLGIGGGGIVPKAKGSIKTPSMRDIDMGAGGGSRSAADIMKVVRQRTPGLRHIYNKCLKKSRVFREKSR